MTISHLGAVTLEKAASTGSALPGDVVTYTLRLRNSSGDRSETVDLVDILPNGFSYRPDTATVAGQPVEPRVAGKQLKWDAIEIAPMGTSVVTYDVVVSGAAKVGSFVNRARAFDPLTGQPVTEEARATVRIEPDPVFQCATVIGRVFDDRNLDGYFNTAKSKSKAVSPEVVERGLPNVRLIAPNGVSVTTDEHGRFSLPCAVLPRQIGSNFMLKLDERTLPAGYRLTTENPRVVRTTAGMLSKMNFGAARTPVARIDISEKAFLRPDALKPALSDGLRELVASIAKRPSVVRIVYQAAETETNREASKKLRIIERHIRKLWAEHGKYSLTVEALIERAAGRDKRK